MTWRQTPVIECEVHFGGKNRPAFVNEPVLIWLDLPKWLNWWTWLIDLFICLFMYWNYYGGLHSEVGWLKRMDWWNGFKWRDWINYIIRLVDWTERTRLVGLIAVNWIAEVNGTGVAVVPGLVVWIDWNDWAGLDWWRDSDGWTRFTGLTDSLTELCWLNVLV